MAISSSIGYQGSVSAVQSASWSAFLGKAPCVATQADWKPTTVTGVDRTVRIAAGLGYGYGVLDTNNANVDLQLATLSSGATRWDAIVARRTWLPGGGTTVFQVVTGSTAKAVPTLQSAVGSVADQLIALVQVTGGVQVPTGLIDCRVATNGGAYTRDGADLLGIPMGPTAWSTLTLKSGNQTGTSLTGVQTPAIRVTAGGRIASRGSVSLTNGNGYPNNATLICDGTAGSAIPATYRPDRMVTLTLACEQRSGYNTVRGQVDNLGNLTIWVPSGVTDLPHWVSLEASWAPSTTY